jgi:hypothetical protein
MYSTTVNLHLQYQGVKSICKVRFRHLHADLNGACDWGGPRATSSTVLCYSLNSVCCKVPYPHDFLDQDHNFTRNLLRAMRGGDATTRTPMFCIFSARDR